MRRKPKKRPLTATDIGTIARRIKRMPAMLDGLEVVYKGYIIFVYLDADATGGRPHIAEVWDNEGRELTELRDALQILVE
ncbi:hypothetical protein D1647_18230 [Alistipes sp. Z76]|nr:hypothetical protein [Alistipes sp. Z76]NCE70104.1 hypothetical protein [Muribaculaceae bacterium M3]